MTGIDAKLKCQLRPTLVLCWGVTPRNCIKRRELIGLIGATVAQRVDRTVGCR